MKQITTLILSLCMFLSSFSASAANDGIKNAIDELNYALAVEWDQKDPAFYQKEINAFKTRIQALRAQGMNNAELIDGTLALVSDKKTKEDLQTAFRTLELNSLSEAEAMKLIEKVAKESKTAGASWNGEIFMMMLPGLLVGALVIFLIASLGSGDGEEVQCENDCPAPNPNQPYYQCSYRNTCFGMYGPNRDDLGFPVGNGSFGSCGYDYVCGWYSSPF